MIQVSPVPEAKSKVWVKPMFPEAEQGSQPQPIHVTPPSCILTILSPNADQLYQTACVCKGVQLYFPLTCLQSAHPTHPLSLPAVALLLATFLWLSSHAPDREALL